MELLIAELEEKIESTQLEIYSYKADVARFEREILTYTDIINIRYQQMDFSDKKIRLIKERIKFISKQL